ncbi:MAG: GGDEF domain-containing protein, partial [Acetatifactor sp.]|nr:GGDEF domain-containing protein [Acetatifactor sp.]
MKIPDYISEHPAENMIFCSVSVNHEYMVMIGDEYFYHFLGRTVGICILDCIHPDLREEFRQICGELKAGEAVRLLTAMRGVTEVYQQVDLTVSNNGRMVGGEPVWELTIYNLFNIEKQYIQASNDANRYRAFLSMYQDYLFDYDVERDCIAVYRYVGIKSSVLMKCSLNQFRESVIAMYPRESFQEELEEFCRHLLSAQENFSCDLRGPVPNRKTVMGLVHIEGKVIYKHNKERVVLGILKLLDQKQEDSVPYYATAEGKDSFTGLLNKRACAEYAAEMLAAGSEIHYMAMIDIDNFKNVNDTYGHMYGDQVISQVASIINSTLNGRGIAGRFGGDEFFIFTNWITSEIQLRAVLTAIRKRVQNTFENQKQGCRVTLSIGVSRSPEDGRTYDELFKKADKCLY